MSEKEIYDLIVKYQEVVDIIKKLELPIMSSAIKSCYRWHSTEMCRLLHEDGCPPDEIKKLAKKILNPRIDVIKRQEIYKAYKETYKSKEPVVNADIKLTVVLQNRKQLDSMYAPTEKK